MTDEQLARDVSDELQSSSEGEEEEDAAAAIALAAYALDAAEWAVVDAALARAQAGELTRTGPCRSEA